ncbi:MAG TPA: hypothetical protein VK348_08330, partial [Planctomycetota bacterium]|nr:hypothetical protein [Planctomycetota bacterium]
MARQRIVGVADSNVGVPAPGRHSAKRFSSTQIALLLVITLLAAVLRLFRLGDWSLWVDEANTWRDVTMPLWGDGGFFSGYRGWYPLSFLLLRSLLDHGLLPMWSEGWLRLPFACCGILTVPALAVFGNLLVGRRAALLSALFLAVNPWHIYWSQNIRGYVLVFFFAIVAAGVFWLGALRGSWRLRLLGLLTAVVGGLCHPTA